MALSSDALIATLSGQLTAQAASIAELQMQLGSGQVLTKPSDNPAAVTQVLALSSQATQLTSWQSNVDLATSWLGVANGAANSALASMQSARSLLLQAINQGTQNAVGYQALGTQLSGVAANLLSLANTQFEGRAIFAGTSASPQAYDASGTFLGTTQSPTVIAGPGAGSGESLVVSVPGTALFGSDATNVFATLSAASSALASGAPSAASLSTALDALDAVIAGAQGASAVLGESSQMASSAGAALTSQIAAVQSSQASLENVNVPTPTTQLSLETTSYQAALWAASQAIPETLVKFL